MVIVLPITGDLVILPEIRLPPQQPSSMPTSTPSLSPEEILDITQTRRTIKKQAVDRTSGKSEPGAFSRPGIGNSSAELSHDEDDDQLTRGVTSATITESETGESLVGESSADPNLIQATLVLEDQQEEATPDPEAPQDPESPRRKSTAIIVAAQPVKRIRSWLAMGISALLLVVIACVTGYLLASGGSSNSNVSTATDTNKDTVKSEYSEYSRFIALTALGDSEVCSATVDEAEPPVVQVHIDCGEAVLKLGIMDNIECSMDTDNQHSATCIDPSGEPFSIIEFICAGPGARATATSTFSTVTCTSRVTPQPISTAFGLFEVCPEDLSAAPRNYTCSQTAKVGLMEFCVEFMDPCIDCRLPLPAYDPIQAAATCPSVQMPVSLEHDDWVHIRFQELDHWLSDPATGEIPFEPVF